MFSGNPQDFQIDTGCLRDRRPLTLMFLFGFATRCASGAAADMGKGGRWWAGGRREISDDAEGFCVHGRRKLERESEGGIIHPCDKVVVTEIRGLRLKVRKMTPEERNMTQQPRLKNQKSRGSQDRTGGRGASPASVHLGDPPILSRSVSTRVRARRHLPPRTPVGARGPGCSSSSVHWRMVKIDSAWSLLTFSARTD